MAEKYYQSNITAFENSLVITIPTEIVQRLRLVKGEMVKITMNQDKTLTVDPNARIEDKALDELVEHAMSHYSEVLRQLNESDG
ncbi:AbrB/MazE/SpoVT family DNA-binding domain-containing protein [Lactiplantibacillus nangangensis]|uniref:AbrB/MazE/SpoVT family DNA-binding domain-containing protein n=1 Tax=Lactiplantibacillus nangangensis TaxID=2559917 RepID=A0ABW1SHR8_9LACO|nr:hypothetical protein [Lactiplantibacillus nangangensis]